MGPDTPLGRIVAIRAEKDPETIKKFNDSERNIYNEWKRYKYSLISKENKEKKRSQTNEELCNLIRSFFG